MNGEDVQFAFVMRPDEQLAGIEWPSMEEFDPDTLDVGDVFVLCGGFEDRANDVLERIVQEGQGKGIAIVLVNYLPDYEENKAVHLRDMARKSGMEVRECTYDRQSPARGGEDVLEKVKGAGRVYVDISGMSRLLIVQTLVALVQAGLPITVVYGEAAEYSPSEEEFEKRVDAWAKETTLDFLSSGVFEVAVTPELGAVSMVGEAIRLVVFPSLEAVQMKNLLQEVQPTYVEVVHGVPPATKNKWRRWAAEKLNAGALERQTGVTEHETSTLYYQETISLLLDVYARRSMFDRILVAPTGSKMQAVAVGLVRAVLTDIQIVYPTPHHLKPSTYTEGLRRIHQVRVPSLTEFG